MDLDLDRWRRLRRADADAADDSPTFVQVQEANDRRARAQITLARFKADGPRGHASGPPLARAAGETIIEPGIGGHSHDDVARSFKTSVAELEARVAAAEGESARLTERLRVCNERRSALQRLIEDVRRWAAEQTPPIVLPGDDGRFVPPPGIVGARSVHIAGPPPGTHDFLGRPT
jgi:uncharacterized small protein (DUF1192 family)